MDNQKIIAQHIEDSLDAIAVETMDPWFEDTLGADPLHDLVTLEKSLRTVNHTAQALFDVVLVCDIEL